MRLAFGDLRSGQRPNQETRAERFVNGLAVAQLLELAVGFDAAVLAHAQEENAVNGGLDGVVELPLVELLVAGGEVAGQRVAPGFDFLQESGIDEFDAELRFVVAGVVGGFVIGEAVDEVQDFARGGDGGGLTL